jgi:hypothetical protein
MTPLNVFVLGAGASYVHGAPLTDEIVPLALTQLPDSDNPRLGVLRDFLERAFHFDTAAFPLVEEKPGDDPHWRNCPGLVDLLSVVDMALDRRENLVEGFNQDRLRELRQSLEFAIFKSLEWTLSWQNPTGRRSNATKRLVEMMHPQDSIIISFNYDVVADIALAKRADASFDFSRADVEVLSEPDELKIDYKVKFANLPGIPESDKRFELLKLHGSFNWVMSALTGNLYFGGLQKAVGTVMDYQASLSGQQKRAATRVGDMFGFFDQRSMTPDPDAEIAALEPVLITPTHLKDLRNHHLSLIWRAAEEALRRAQRITFIGYSLPGDDLHIKYLFKHALETRYLNEAPAIVVVDYHNQQREPEGSLVEANYRRFFGDIEFHPHGFDAYMDEIGG